MDNKTIVGLKSKEDDSDDENTPLTTINDPTYRAGTTNESLARRKVGKVVFLFVLVLAAILVIFAVGFAVGLGTSAKTIARSSHDSYKWGDKVSKSGKSAEILNWFDGVISADNIKDNLINLTQKPHIAGSAQNLMLADIIYKQWRGFAFDNVQQYNYSVLLSYPNASNPNKLQLRSNESHVLYEGHSAQEPPLTPGENDSTVASPFNAYSGSGIAMGPLVYVNYAEINDFLFLTANLSLNLTGHICIARYGAIYRGDKAHFSEKYGCKGLLIYSDPHDYAPKTAPVYPNGPGLPPGGVQRGTLMIMEGDPLTPGIPAIDGMYRRSYDEVIDSKTVPLIPVQPISYEDAVIFLSQLQEMNAPSSWIGGLNITYKIKQAEHNTNYTYLAVNNYQERRNISNVVATIFGAVEPDRQVILGNHRDAWVFGAVDPNSGTAVLMELARGLSELRKTGWRPGRTIMLCSWDAEEYGLMGSTEWLEEHGKLVGANTVAYLNVDFAVTGSQLLRAQANPLLYQVVWRASKLVRCPDNAFETVYDQWIHSSSKNYNGTSKPLVKNLGSGSDFTMFLQTQGVSCLSINYANETSYQVYHSVHDNFYWMSHFADPDFEYHVATGLVWIKAALLIATTPVLPYDPRDFAVTLHEIFSNLQHEYGELLTENGISLDHLSNAVSNFNKACVDAWNEMQHIIEKVNDISQEENLVRIINNKLINLERAFLHPEGLPGRNYFKHVVFAPSSLNSYDSSLFPGVSDAIFNATLNGNLKANWNEVHHQIDIVRNHVQYATQILNDPSLKYAPVQTV